MIFCARATRGLRRPSLDARSGRSISPHPWKIASRLEGSIRWMTVARCAQSRIDQVTLEKEVGDGMRHAVKGCLAPPIQGPTSSCRHLLLAFPLKVE